VPTVNARLLTLATVVFLTGCAVATAPGYLGPDVQPTNHTQSKQQYRGFSVHPPMNAGWTVKVSEQSPQQAIYRRELPTNTHTLIAGAALVQLDKSVPLEEALPPRGFENSQRYDVLENSHEPDHSRKLTCVTYSIRLKDIQAPNSPGAPLILIDRGFVCAHPTFPGMAVRASYSERGLESELDAGLWGDFQAFLSGVQIESSAGVPAA
jgi:hypothetical protein